MADLQKGLGTRVHRLGIFGSVAVLTLLLSPALRAQVSGAISGTALDPSGAVLPAVQVTVQNLETRAVRSALSDGTGHYSVLSLPVGRYEVKAQKEGFRAEVRTGNSLAVGQEATVDLVLQVGSPAASHGERGSATGQPHNQ